MTIYISTGGFANIPAYKSVATLSYYGARNIELSGGVHSNKNIKFLKSQKKKIKFSNS